MHAAACLIALLVQDGAAGPAAPAKPDSGRTIAVPIPRPRAPDVASYRVALKLKSGRRFTGVVGRDLAFHESVRAGAHHAAAIYQSPARFKLRYVDGLDGEIELTWQQIERLDVREILDSAGLRAMDQRFSASRIERRLKAAAVMPAAPEVAPGTEAANPPAAIPVVAPVPGSGEVRPPELPLLVEFPPEQGWSPDRKKQIEWRRTVVGEFPDPRAARFLEVYDRFEPLFAAWDLEQRQKREAEAAKTKKPADSARVPVNPAPAEKSGA
ncbi:MAG: hypothetical protein EXS13_02405 [Planctomycetes bacterium]|nr:hypothetical protein [Planctomycetota bacterium]